MECQQPIPPKMSNPPRCQQTFVKNHQISFNPMIQKVSQHFPSISPWRSTSLLLTNLCLHSRCAGAPNSAKATALRGMDPVDGLKLYGLTEKNIPSCGDVPLFSQGRRFGVSGFSPSFSWTLRNFFKGVHDDQPCQLFQAVKNVPYMKLVIQFQSKNCRVWISHLSYNSRSQGVN